MPVAARRYRASPRLLALLDCLGPVLADVFEVPPHKTFSGALVIAHDRGEQWPVFIG